MSGSIQSLDTTDEIKSAIAMIISIAVMAVFELREQPLDCSDTVIILQCMYPHGA